MIRSLAIILAFAFASSIPTVAEEAVSIDVRTQQVSAKYGVASQILRTFQQAQEPSTRAGGGYLFRFDGQPGIQLVLDRNYWVLGLWNPEKEKEPVSYMFNPVDEQSALNLGVVKETDDKPEPDRSTVPGFTGMTYAEGVVGGQKVKWQRWGDATHLYSECKLSLLVGTKADSPQQRMVVYITANTEERRKALEDAMASLELH